MRSAHVIPLLLALACNRSDNRQREQVQGTAPPLSGALQHGMRNCPSAVPGAKTLSTRTPVGVQLMITADHPDAQRQIITLARMHAGWSQPVRELPPHTGMHSGPATIGRCPIIHANTLVTTETLPRGVRVTVKARDRAQVPELQAMTELRVHALQQPSS